MNQQTLSFKHGVYVASRGTAASMKEGQGPIGSDIDQIFDDLYCGEKNWDQAERTLMRTAVLQCLQKKKYTYSDVDLLLAGDLNNQLWHPIILPEKWDYLTLVCLLLALPPWRRLHWQVFLWMVVLHGEL